MSLKKRDKFIKIPTAVELTCLSRSVIYGKVKRGEFPPIIKLSERTSVFSFNAVMDWIEQQKEKNNQEAV